MEQESKDKQVKHDAFRYDFTFKELMYFLFGSKKCPNCKHKMIRHKTSETRDGGEFYSPSSENILTCNTVKYYGYKYTCQHCGGTYTLTELAEKK